MKKTSLLVLLALSACAAPTTPSVNPSADPSATPSASASASPSPTASASPAPASGLNFKYLGRGADKVRPAFSGGPDGTPDYSFGFTYDFGAAATLRSIVISSVINGVSGGPTGWMTGPGKYWLLQASANGKDYNSTAKTTDMGAISGVQNFVLTGATLDPTLFAAGTVYELKLTYEVGGEFIDVSERLTL
ncbi:MAG: hypothetical protein ACO1RX_03510 [Candidatus Sericytochromatia bacterium]